MKKTAQTFLPLIRAIGICAIPLIIQGCAMSKFTDGLGSGLWSASKKKDVTHSTAQPVSQDVLLAAAKADISGEATGFPTADSNCPQFVVWPSDRRLTKYEDKKQGDSLAVIYRGEITKNARECKIAPGEISVKYGVAGRVLLGPKGGTDTVQLPIIIHVTDRDRKKISTQRFAIPVNVSRENPIGYFSVVKELSFKIPQGVRPLDYKLYVAFEQNVS
ncbi:MAG: hypothetical protein AAF228_02415 [Pseudomonadota bacterium]